MVGSQTLGRSLAMVVALGMALGPLGTGRAVAAPTIGPDGAEARRQEVRTGLAGKRDAGDWAAVAEGFEEQGKKLGDPVLMIEAADARLQLADAERSTDEAEIAIEDARVALDMLHFLAAVKAGETPSSYIPIPLDDASTLIERGDAQIAKAEELIEAIEEERRKAARRGNDKADAGDDDEKQKKKRKRDRKPGTGLLIAGSVLTVVGVGGGGMAVAGLMVSRNKQKEIEELGVEDPEIDKQGKRANIIGYAGIGVAAAGLAIGIPLIVVGAKRRKKAGDNSTKASLRVAPMWAGRTDGGGLSISGRF